MVKTYDDKTVRQYRPRLSRRKGWCKRRQMLKRLGEEANGSKGNETMNSGKPEKPLVIPSLIESEFRNQETYQDVTPKNIAGIGYAQLKEQCAAMNLNCMTERTYIKYRENVLDAFTKNVMENMKIAGEVEKQLAIQRNEIINGIPYISVIADGSWMERSYGKGYHSLSGIGTIIGYRTRKILFSGIRNKYCTVCDRAERIGCEQQEDDDCICLGISKQDITEEDKARYKKSLDDIIAPISSVQKNVLPIPSKLNDESLDRFLRVIRETSHFETQSMLYLKFSHMIVASRSDKNLQIIRGNCSDHWRCIFFDGIKLHVYDIWSDCTYEKLLREVGSQREKLYTTSLSKHKSK